MIYSHGTKYANCLNLVKPVKIVLWEPVCTSGRHWTRVMEQDSGSLDNQACKFYLAFLTYKSSKNVGIHSEIFLK